MITSTVQISMRNESSLDCSYAIVTKGKISIVIILRNSECGIFNRNVFSSEAALSYLLLKHYPDDNIAYMDFLKLIGKMCKKDEKSKYFKNPKTEDNRMVVTDFGKEHMISDSEILLYNNRYNNFLSFVSENRNRF